MKISVPVLIAMLTIGNATAAPTTCSVSVSNEPLVMRMSKDEFRIVFGVNGDECNEGGCTGTIQYKAAWRTEEGAESVDSKMLSYSIPSGASRSIAVDRHYFDLGEGRHTTDLVHVSVGEISCVRSQLTVAR